MNWLNLKTTQSRSPEFIECEPVARGTWLSVLLWCAEQENSGRIEGAKKWTNRQWQQTCGVTLSEINSASPLLVWDGETLIAWGYPVDQETVCQAKRETARSNGNRGGRPPTRKPESEPTLEPTLVATLEPALGPIFESVKKGKIKEGKEKKSLLAPAVADAVIPSSLDSDEFRAAWADWKKHRVEIRSPLKFTSETATLKAMELMGQQRAIAAIRHTIFKGWRGLREPEGQEIKQFQTAPLRPVRAEPRGWKQWLDENRQGSAYSKGGEHADKDWNELDDAVQRMLFQEMQKKSG